MTAMGGGEGGEAAAGVITLQGKDCERMHALLTQVAILLALGVFLSIGCNFHFYFFFLPLNSGITFCFSMAFCLGSSF